MNPIKIFLRSGEKIFVNGAVLRADRKVTIEFLNSVTFLLEQHVMKPEDTTTPLRQLYFMVQTALMDPQGSEVAIGMAKASLQGLHATFKNPEILAELIVIDDLLRRGRTFETLRVLRRLFPIEQSIINPHRAAVTPPEPRVAACK